MTLPTTDYVLINVSADPYYTGIKLLDGQKYKFTFRWNIYRSVWIMDLFGLNNDVNVNSISVLPGRNLLHQYGYYQLGEIWCVDNSGADGNPNYDDFGSQHELRYYQLVVDDPDDLTVAGGPDPS